MSNSFLEDLKILARLVLDSYVVIEGFYIVTFSVQLLNPLFVE